MFPGVPSGVEVPRSAGGGDTSIYKGGGVDGVPVGVGGVEVGGVEVGGVELGSTGGLVPVAGGVSTVGVVAVGGVGEG